MADTDSHYLPESSVELGPDLARRCVISSLFGISSSSDLSYGFYQPQSGVTLVV